MSRLSPKSKKFVFEFGCQIIPHPDKKYKGGEDAVLTQKNILVVADGVGGWSKYGIDPAIYAKNLCSLIANLYDTNRLHYQENPQELLELSVSYNRFQGSSTVTIITLNENTGQVKIAYMGDSLLSMYRRGTQMLKTKQHSRAFNQPYQVGIDADSPSECLTEQQSCKHGDVFIVGSDGVWDNLYDVDVQKAIKASRDMQGVAEGIAGVAYVHSQDNNFQSPFQTKAIQNGFQYKGGKPDDISVIAAKVVLN